MPALVQMQRKYTLNVNGVRLADAFYIAYARRKLLLRLGAGHQSQIPLLVEHAKLGTVFRYRLDREGNEPWVSPRFQAQVTWGPDEQGQFELTVLDDADLSGLQQSRK